MIKVAHISLRYSPYERADIHRELSSRNDFDSLCLVENLIYKERPHGLKNLVYYRMVGKSKLGDFIYKISDRILFGITRRRFYRFAESKLKRFKPDIIHAHFGMAGAAVMGFVESLKVPLVVTFYGVDISYCLKFKYWVKRYQELFKKADRLVVLCEEAKKRLVDIGCQEGKIRVWNCLVDLEGYPYAPRQDAKGRIKFITAARFVEKKGYRILLEAFKRLIVEGRDFYLTAAGYGPLREDIQKTINEDGLSDRVRLINTENVPDFYSLFKELLYSHDIFVMASVRSKSGDDEGGPALSLIYAQSSGMPVIASDFPGAERSVLDGKTGLVFSSGDVDGLKDRMAYLAEDSDARSRLGRQGSQFVKDRFSIAGQTEEIIRIYREAMGRP